VHEARRGVRKTQKRILVGEFKEKRTC